MADAITSNAPVPMESKSNLRKVIMASSAGTLIEWYDFYIFGALAGTIADVFFPKTGGATALLSTLATFAIGFVVRPFGSLVFGRVGDVVGRKYAFLVTLLLMGGATFLIGVLPGYEKIGWLAPTILIVLRLLQGLALGGEYGGAATYVAEHCPDGQRGYYTSWIQTTATLGLFVSLGVILACRKMLSVEDFNAWGWRIPFLISLILVIFSYVIRSRMQESPLFQRMKSSGKASKSPLRDSFGKWENLKMVLLALFGATAGQGVVWYTGQFYAMFFIKNTLGVENVQAEYIVAAALVIGTPFFVFFGWLSDRIGRKPIMMMGCLLAILAYYPIYTQMAAQADVKNAARFTIAEGGVQMVSQEPKITVVPADAAKNEPAKTVTVVVEKRTYTDGTVNTVTITSTQSGGQEPKIAEKNSIVLSTNHAVMLSALVLIQVLFVTMVYGPIAAFLVELFPTKIRYTSMSLPYHIGNGVFGGLVPFIGTYMVTQGREVPVIGSFIADTWGQKYAGLIYPMVIALMTLIVGTLLIRENRKVRMHDEVHE